MQNFLLQHVRKCYIEGNHYSWYQLRNASPTEVADIMRNKFYHCGKNVQLFTTGFGTEPYLINIEDNVTVAANVHFVTHDVSCFNMARFLGLEETCLDKVGPITLHDNCFVGMLTFLMPGCSVGKNSVIAAGSVVTACVPDNQVWGGACKVYNDYRTIRRKSEKQGVALPLG